MTDGLRRLLTSRAAGWGVAAVAILALIGLWSRPRVITTVVHDRVEVNNTVTKYVESTTVKTKILGCPTCRVTVYPDGHYVIDGAFTLDQNLSRSVSGEASSHQEIRDHQQTVTRPVDRNWSASFGVFSRFPYLPPVPVWAGSLGYRIIGPWWVEGHVALEPGHLPSLGVQARVEWSF